MKKNIDSVIDFAESRVDPTIETVDNPNLRSAPYRSTTWVHYSSVGDTFAAGVWEAEACCEQFVSVHDEFCHVIQGTIRLTDEEGRSKSFGPGSYFTVPHGFAGLWENIGTVRKAFAITA